MVLTIFHEWFTLLFFIIIFCINRHYTAYVLDESIEEY